MEKGAKVKTSKRLESEVEIGGPAGSRGRSKSEPSTDFVPDLFEEGSQEVFVEKFMI